MLHDGASHVAVPEPMKHHVTIVEKRIRVHRRDIAYVKHIFEGYEDFATVTVMRGGNGGVLVISIVQDFEQEAYELLNALREEIEMEIGDQGLADYGLEDYGLREKCLSAEAPLFEKEGMGEIL